jgi:hypothetical protein
MMPMLAALPASGHFSRPSSQVVARRWSLDVSTSASGSLAMYGTGSRIHAVSTSEMRASKPMRVKRWMSVIFSRPILWNVLVPHPKSSVVSPLDIEKVGTFLATRYSSSLSSMAPTRKAVHPVPRSLPTQLSTKSR